MCYREEAIECVKDHVLQIHKQIYAKYNGDFDRIYTEGYNNKSYTGRVIEPGKVYIRSSVSAHDRAFYISCHNLNQTVISKCTSRIPFSGEATAAHSE